MLYPLKFLPVYKNYLWGGRNLESKFRRTIPEGPIAESWEICCRNEEMSIISNGYLKGKSLNDIINLHMEELLGKNFYNKSHETFPLLIKLIDANDKLSVQVHPDDLYAKKNGDSFGKTEMWYVIDAKPGAKLVYGLKGSITRDDFLETLKDRNIKNLLNEVPVSTGDTFFIPAGTVHALLDGILVAEVQQNSNTTYRIYDWDRIDASGNPRELHLDKALDVINFNFVPNSVVPVVIHDSDDYASKLLVDSDYFSTEEIVINSKYTSTSDGSRFFIYMAVYGRGSIIYSDGVESICAGETILIPASLGSYEIIGKLKMLKIF